MRTAYLKNSITNCIDEIACYTWEEFPYDNLSDRCLRTGNSRGLQGYLQNICTFDIETTTIAETKQAWMYHWQMSIDGYNCYGRTWKEWEGFLSRLCKTLNVTTERKLAIYVHNLGFEYQFMKKFLARTFGEYKVFAPQKRKPLRVETENGLEFRCSWKLSNMSLEKFLKNEKNVEHLKAKGDLDYKIIRTPETPLTDEEFGYCIADVQGLYEAIKSRLEHDNDTLATIPMTSTGYPRRDCRRACQADRNYRKIFKRCAMRKGTYELLKEAARGGDTHANRRMAGRIIEDIDCYDAQSEYPAMQLLKPFPMTAFTRYGAIESFAELNELLDTKACLFRWTAIGVRLKDEISMPYIPDAKCRHLVGALRDNGRILKADGLSMTLTDIDYKLIKAQYEIEEEYVSDLQIAEYGMLPKPIRDTIMGYFQAKTELKYKRDQYPEDSQEYKDLDYLYGKSKNKLNGIFGMMYTDPVHDLIYESEDGTWKQERPEDIDAALEKYNTSRNSFLVYAWGIWTTAHGRAHLARLVRAGGQENAIYQDTDSDKGRNLSHAGIEKENQKIIQECEENHAYADAGEKRYYMGVYERERGYSSFSTLGAKKYAYVQNKKLHVTISGVNKEKGGKELEKLENFRLGFTFRDAGGTELTYNEADIHTITVDGCEIETAANIAVTGSTYTLGITQEYADIIGETFDIQ